MAKFKKKGKGDALKVNTSALPDIFFMLLFFFMVSTTLRETEVKVKIDPVEATEIQKIERNFSTYIYIGKPNNAELYGSVSRLQLNDQIAGVNQIPRFIDQEREEMGEEYVKMNVVLKVDKDTKMGVITDVKETLRDAQAYRIVYSARDGS